MRHQHVRAHPDIVAGLDARLAGSTREQFFSQSHNLNTIAELRREFNCAIETQRALDPRFDLYQIWKLNIRLDFCSNISRLNQKICLPRSTALFLFCLKSFPLDKPC
jgi:hypothetical protein